MVARKNLFTSLGAAVLAGLVQNAEADCKCVSILLTHLPV